MHETWVPWNALRKYGLAFTLVGLSETEVRRMSEELKMADSGVVFEGPGDESANEWRLECTLDFLKDILQLQRERGVQD